MSGRIPNCILFQILKPQNLIRYVFLKTRRQTNTHIKRPHCNHKKKLNDNKDIILPYPYMPHILHGIFIEKMELWWFKNVLCTHIRTFLSVSVYLLDLIEFQRDKTILNSYPHSVLSVHACTYFTHGSFCDCHELSVSDYGNKIFIMRNSVVSECLQ